MEKRPKNEGNYHPAKSTSIVTVFDIESSGWRSFDLTTLVKDVKVIEIKNLASAENFVSKDEVLPETETIKYNILTRLFEIEQSREKFKSKLKKAKRTEPEYFFIKMKNAVNVTRAKLSLEVKDLRKKLESL